MPVSQVDSLEFTILVDNIVEWFSPLPPGFSHEIPQHLNPPAPHKPPMDPLTGLPFLKFDEYCCGAHGLSIVLKTTIGDQTYHVLMDGGPEQLSIERNAEALHVPMDKLDAIVLSHWHSDHSGGILKALELRQASSGASSAPLKVDLHPDRPIRRGISRPPDFKPVVALMTDPSFDEIKTANGVPNLHDEAHEMLRGATSDREKMGIWVSGEIERRTGFERGVIGGITWMEEDGGGDWFTDELIKDERYVVVDVKGKGLVIFSSCSHAGICNVVLSAVQHHPGRPIHMIVGGLHLVPANVQPVAETIDFLSRRIDPLPDYILPLHCTGLEARGKLMAALGERCVPAGVGMKVVVAGDDALEAELERRDVKVAINA